MSTLSGWKGSFYCTEHRAPTEQEIFDEGVAEGKRRMAARPYPAALLLPAYDPNTTAKAILVQAWTKGNDLPVDAFYEGSDAYGKPYFYDGASRSLDVELWSYPSEQ